MVAVMGMQARAMKSLPLFCVLAFLVQLLPTLALLLTLQFTMQQLGLDMTVWNRGPSADPGPKSVAWILGSAIFAPVAETFLIAFVIGLAQSGAVPERLHALVAALVLAGLHGWWGGVFWFVGVFWAFVVNSYAFILWRPVSFRHAFAAAAIPHALVNLTAGVAGRLWP